VTGSEHQELVSFNATRDGFRYELFLVKEVLEDGLDRTVRDFWEWIAQYYNDWRKEQRAH